MSTLEQYRAFLIEYFDEIGDKGGWEAEKIERDIAFGKKLEAEGIPIADTAIFAAAELHKWVEKKKESGYTPCHGSPMWMYFREPAA